MISDEEFERNQVRIKELRAEHVARALQAYSEAAVGVIADLRAAGWDVEHVQDLRCSGKRYASAVPVLAEWLPLVSYISLKEDILRTLAVPWARGSAQVLLDEFVRPTYGLYDIAETKVDPDDHIRWIVGLALCGVADDTLFDQIAPLAQDRRWGDRRAQLVLALGKMKKHPEVVPLLIEQLEDPAQLVVLDAMAALRKLKAAEAAPAVSRLRCHPSDDVRKAAKSWLKRFSRQETEN